MTYRAAHPYMPSSNEHDRAIMLEAVGAADIEELFEQIPAAHRAAAIRGVAEGVRSEAVLERSLDAILRRNQSTRDTLSFIGAGLWPHHVPALCDEIAGRNEFVTSVWGTPSSDFGRNQAWFEFASQLGALVDMDFVGLPVYSWGSAGGNAVRMAARITGRSRVLVSSAIDPERRAVMQTFAGLPGGHRSLELVDIPTDLQSGTLELDALRGMLDDSVAAVYLDSPNYWGLLESGIDQVVAMAHAAGAEVIVGVDPISLGVIGPPSQFGADITVGSIQPLGVPLGAGGGVGGFIATRDEEKYAREFPTLQVSITGTSRPGERAFGMTLFEQSSYGSREDGNDWTGNSVYLSTIRSTVYMALMGPQGFADIGGTIAANAHAAANMIAEVDGVSIRYPGGFFKEFVVDFGATGHTVAEVNRRLLTEGIFGGLDLSSSFPQLGQSALYCVTEVHTVDDIERLVAALRKAVR